MTTDAGLYSLAKRLYPLPRTVQGPAVLQTLDILDEWIPLERHEMAVGTKVFDWTVLPEHENRRHYHPTLADLPPYGGPLAWGECTIKGEVPEQVLLSTYTCHPQLANDNVSGMVVTVALAKWIASAPRHYTYRILFAPETIGALAWLSRQDMWLLKRNTIAGYTINCCGDERAWSFLPSRRGDTLADRAAMHVLQYHLQHLSATFPIWYGFKDRGSDERQFCAPGVDLPVASVMRSKHGTFPEYHTTADNLNMISPKGLGDSLRCYQRIIETIEANRTYRVTTIGEPMLSKYGLYPSGTVAGPTSEAILARNICAYADGQTDLLAIAEIAQRPMWEVAPVAKALLDAGLVSCQ